MEELNFCDPFFFPLNSLIYLCHFEEVCNSVHPDEELLVDVQGFPGLLLVHVKVFLQEVDDPVVVAGEQSDEVFEQEDEGCVDDPVVQVAGRSLEFQKGVNLWENNTSSVLSPNATPLLGHLRAHALRPDTAMAHTVWACLRQAKAALRLGLHMRRLC